MIGQDGQSAVTSFDFAYLSNALIDLYDFGRYQEYFDQNMYVNFPLVNYAK